MTNRYILSAALCASLLYIPFAVFASNPKTAPHPRPVCVHCTFNGGCRACSGGGGALYCETFNCAACSEEGECDGGPGGILRASPKIAAVAKSEEPLRISARIIRDIGMMHPRFAITLAEMNGYGGVSSGERRIYWTPIKFSSSDVEKFLKKEAHSKYFKQFDREVRRLNGLIQTGELSDIVYRVSTKQTDDGGWSIKMHVESVLTAASTVDPAFSTLQIQARSSQAAQAAVGDRSRTKTTFEWQIQ